MSREDYEEQGHHTFMLWTDDFPYPHLDPEDDPSIDMDDVVDDSITIDWRPF